MRTALTLSREGNLIAMNEFSTRQQMLSLPVLCTQQLEPCFEMIG